MPSSVEVSPEDLLAHAQRVESIRAAIHPGTLPVGFAPAGADGASASIATQISAEAAAVVNGLWGVWSALGKIADTLRANAHGYQSRDEANRSLLSGGSGAVSAAPGPLMPQVAPVASPMVHVGPPSATPEELSSLIRSGAGQSSPEQFGQQWAAHAAVVDAAVTDLAGVRGSLGASWRGDAHDGAASSFSAAEADLSAQHGKVAKVGSAASTHALDYKRTVDAIPRPSQFAGWWQDYDSAAAAEAQQPGQHTQAVIAAQQQLNKGWTDTTEAYAPYAVDPQTGDLIDPATGQPIPGTADLAAALGAGEEDAGEGEGLDDSMTSQAGQMLTGLLGGVVGAATGAVGAVTQPVQQGVQAATQAFGQVAKGMGQGQDSGLSAEGLDGLGGSDFSGGGGGSGGGSGGGGAENTGPAAFAARGVGTAAAPPPSTGQGSVRVGAAPSASGGGMGMGGMGAPFMGGPGAGGGGAAGGAKATADGKKLLAPRQANTQRVIGETSAARISDKKAARERVMAEAKEAKEAAQKDGAP